MAKEDAFIQEGEEPKSESELIADELVDTYVTQADLDAPVPEVEPEEFDVSELGQTQKKESSEPGVGDIAARAALSAAMAVSMSAALSEPPQTDKIQLPDPVPFVQQYEVAAKKVMGIEEPEVDEKQIRRERLLKLLKFLVVALIFIATVAFSMLKGCVSCTAPLLAPPEEQGSTE